MPFSIQSLSTSTAFTTEAAGIVSHLVHISALCSLFFNAVKGLLQASDTHVPYGGEIYCDVLH